MSVTNQSSNETRGTAAPKLQAAIIQFGATPDSALLHDPKQATGKRRTATAGDQFPSLESLTRPTVPTPQAAHYLIRKPQTLRSWACREDGPIRPIRINGRLAWSVAKIRQLLGVAQ